MVPQLFESYTVDVCFMYPLIHKIVWYETNIYAVLVQYPFANYDFIFQIPTTKDPNQFQNQARHNQNSKLLQ